MSNVKGSGWLTAKEYYLKTIGEENYKKALLSLGAEDQAVFSKPILPITWIDYGAFMRFQIAIDKMCGQGDFEMIRQANYYGARKDITGMYKILFRVMTPEFIMNNVAKLWSQYYDTGKMAVVKKERGHVTLEITDIPDIPLYHEHENLAYSVETLRMCNCKNIRTAHPRCIARGDASCILELSWE